MMILIIMNSLFSLATFAYKLRRNKTESFFYLVVTMGIPIFGFAFLISLWILNKKTKFESKISLHTKAKDENIIEKKSGGLGYSLDYNEAIPFEEALIINDSNIKRRYIIDAIKDDSKKNVRLLKSALYDENSEVSHYAAAAITEVKNNISKSIRKFDLKYKENMRNKEFLISYSNELKEYLSSSLLDRKGYLRYQRIYSEVLGDLVKIYRDEEKYFVEKIQCDIDLGEFEIAEKYCKLFMNEHSESPKPYLMYLSLFYKLRDKKNFYRMLKQVQVNQSNSALAVKKFWSGELESEL